METLEVREALETAILLGEVAQTSHTVEINGIGKVQINDGHAAFKSVQGEWLQIDRHNIDRALDTLMAEPMENKIKRQSKIPILS